MQNLVPVKHSGLYLIAICLAVAGVCLLAQPCAAQSHEKEGIGLTLNDNATAKDVGLPIYPRSKPHKEKSNDSPSANLGLWGGGSGFRLSIVKMVTEDSPDKVVAFYKKALSKYGKVLDCSNASPGQREADDSGALTCGDDKPDKGEMLFKAGTKERQHIVSVQPKGQGAYYQLIALDN
ncbi:MAG: hypothetical protein ACM3NO_04380, partial [Deltaproteobacteria bacterium]